ncbi:MAG: hypothetical protein GY757_02715, partial [bacterium]|nr:hypothetical protein [bacterium]
YDISIYDKKPMIHSLALTPDKKLLLAARDKAGTQQLLFRHLYMSSGKRTDIRSGGSYIKITKNFLFLLYENEDDEPLILCLKRRAGEAEDLKRLLNLEITKTDN